MGIPDNAETVIRIENLRKKYRLGVIGSGSLQRDLQSLIARIRKQEDPNLKVDQKAYSRPEDFWALDGIDLSVYRGEALGIIGGNGAGKSTLLKILSRVTAPTEGTVYIKGKIASMLEVGTGFHRELTGRENIYLNGAIMGMSRQEVDAKLDKIIAFSEIGQFIDTPVKRYSSGMYVKLAFAVSAHLDADILIMDEVLAVGDARFQKKCVDKLQQLASEDGKTVLFVSHNMNTISTMCSRCVVLDHGRIQYVGDTGEAIAYYYQYHYGENTVSWDLSRKGRAKSRSYCMKMESLRLLEKESAEYAAGEPIRVSLYWKSDAFSTDVCLRITLNYNGGSVGTYFTESIEGSVLSGKRYKTEFHLETVMLASGTYTASIGLVRHSSDGRYTPLDEVTEAFSFRILNAEKRWNHQQCGSVIFEKADLVNHHIIEEETV